MTRAVRIDTLRNQSHATRQLMALVEHHLEDLHELAYNRRTAAREANVAGGTRDWALDTHGDPRARDAYRALGHAFIDACTTIAGRCHDIIVLLRDSEGTPGRGGRSARIDIDELAEALEAQARRVARGDYTPTPLVAQPDGDARERTIARLRHERDQARAEAARLTRELARYRPPDTPTPRRRRGWQRRSS